MYYLNLKSLFSYLALTLIRVIYVLLITLNYIVFLSKISVLFFYDNVLNYLRFVSILLFFYTLIVVVMLFKLNLMFMRDILFVIYKLQAKLVVLYACLLVWTYETIVWFLYACYAVVYNQICNLLLIFLSPLYKRYPRYCNYMFDYVSYFFVRFILRNLL